jgi:hypothetical protein
VLLVHYNVYHVYVDILHLQKVLIVNRFHVLQVTHELSIQLAHTVSRVVLTSFLSVVQIHSVQAVRLTRSL